MEPPKKQMKTGDNDLKEMIINMQLTFINKLKSIEEKIDKISSKYYILEEKVENVLLKIKESSAKVSHSSLSCSSENPSVSRLISANDEATYPDGSWLGDPNNHDVRVRCSISPVDLETINNTCTTPEKMSLTLLDYLFDRETQAESNISGAGKHGKKQLDPLKIYGIKCHITYMFGTNNKDWHRIKQSIDSKCRTAFRRKRKGMPLVVKNFRDRVPNVLKDYSVKSDECSMLPENLEENFNSENVVVPKCEPESFHDIQENDLGHIIPLKLETDGSFTFTDAHSQIIHTEHGDIQVIQATKEQLEQLKQNHHIEFLNEADIFIDRTVNVAAE